MIALEEKITILPTLFAEKRDGRRVVFDVDKIDKACLLYTSPSPRDRTRSRMPSSA
ncbi:hypothetical protein PVA38_11275 [Streptococcus pneumoniae D39]|nr:hypothetical protein PVA38_11275 [Streptococcus pneumoniae D39]